VRQALKSTLFAALRSQTGFHRGETKAFSLAYAVVHRAIHRWHLRQICRNPASKAVPA
jgi:hypothetical protein